MRGCTCSVLWFDEFGFLKHNKKVWDSAAFAYSKAAEAAEKNGVPHSRLITTTPNHLNCKEGAFCYSIITNGVKFDEKWYDMDIEDVKQEIKDTSKNGFVHIQFSWQELGLSEEWFEEQKRLVNYDLQTIKREILLEWTLSGEGSLFDEDQMSVVEKYVKHNPIGSFYVMGTYKFYIYEELSNVRERNYIVSIDIAGGLEQDSTVVTIIDPLTYKPAAVFKSNTIDTPTLTELLVELVQNFFNNAIIVPERNNMGISVIQMLLKTEIKDNIYYSYKGQNPEGIEEVNPKKNKNTNNKKKVIKNEKRIKVYGIDTTPKTRKIMIDEILNRIVNEEPENINNEFLFNELKTLARNKNGKVEAREGFHDDVVMSYLIGMYCILYGPNMYKFLKVTWGGFNDMEMEATKSDSKNVSKNINNILNISKGNNNPYNERVKKLRESQERIEKEVGLEMNSPIVNKNLNKSSKSVRKNKISKRIKNLYG